MRTFVLLLLTACCSSVFAQQVVATAGSTLSNSTGSISFTIGEGVAQTLTSGDKTLTQGFHQTNIQVTFISGWKDLDFEISVFPNPASDELTIKLSKENLPGLHFMIFDLNGKLQFQSNLKSTITRIPLDQLSAGFYFIKIKDSTKELKTFKIIKE
jgi:hypothetical protein